MKVGCPQQPGFGFRLEPCHRLAAQRASSPPKSQSHQLLACFQWKLGGARRLGVRLSFGAFPTA